VYGGELSSHHYFGDFFSCDSGMYAWLKVVEMICQADESLEEMVAKSRQAFSCCGEMSLKLTDVDLALVELRKQYSKTAHLIEVDDGLAFDMGDWRFSIRESKTEPCVRLNLESRGSGSILLEQGETVLSTLEPFRHEERSWLEDLRIE
jgi:phosphomannomutase